MNGQDFLRVVDGAFKPFLADLGFSMDMPSVSGRLYRATFTGSQQAVSVSFEPGDDALFVMVFNREHGKSSDIDDRASTPRLADLNERYMSAVGLDERAANDSAFKAVEARDDAERALVKSARELRLVLPKYLADRRRHDAPVHHRTL